MACGTGTDNYLRYATATAVRTFIGKVNDSDKLDGEHGSYYLAKTAKAADSDKLDNINSSQFLRSDYADQKTAGHLRFNDNIYLQLGTGSDVEHFWNGSHYYTDINNGGNWYIRDGNSGNATRYTFDVDYGHFNATGTITGTTMRATGNLTTGGYITATGNVTAYSDERLKENLEVIPDALDKITQISGYTYNRTDLNTDDKFAGVIAQEVREVLPEVIMEDENGMLSVAYGNMVGLLIEGIKELREENRILSERLDTISGK